MSPCKFKSPNPKDYVIILFLNDVLEKYLPTLSKQSLIVFSTMVFDCAASPCNSLPNVY